MKLASGRRAIGAVAALATTIGLVAFVPMPAASASPVGTPPSRQGGYIVGWGDDSYGQTDIPPALTGLTVTGVSANTDHVLAVTSTGEVVAWGNDGSGDTEVPAAVTSQRISAVAAGGEHSLALTADGTVLAWGEDSAGQTDVPSTLSGQTVTAIAAGDDFSVALTADGAVVVWGANGDPALTPPSAAASGISAIAAGDHHVLAVQSNGNVVAWGHDDQGETDVPGSLSGVDSVAAGSVDSVALAGGRITTWGDSGNEPPVPVSLQQGDVTAIAAGAALDVGLTSGGAVTAWGIDTDGDTDVPGSLSGQSVTAVAAGGHTGFALVDPPVPGTGPAENFPHPSAEVGDDQSAVPSDNTDQTYCLSNNGFHDEALTGLSADKVPDPDPFAASGLAAVNAQCQPFIASTANLDYRLPPNHDFMRGDEDDEATTPPPAVMCPRGQVVVGISVLSTPEDAAGPLQDIRPYCDVLDSNGVLAGNPVAQPWLFGGVGDDLQTAMCDPGYFAYDIQGDDLDFIDNIGLLCDNPSFTSTQPNNSAWTTADTMPATGSTTQALTTGDGALWYRFPVQPNSSVKVTLTGLAADDDLSAFSDLDQAFDTLTSTQDLTRITAESASIDFSPTTFSPTTFSPTTFSPTTFSPTTFSPTTFSPTTFSPTTFSPTTFSPTTFSPTTFSPDVTPARYTNPGTFSDTSTFEQAYSDAQQRSVLAVSASNGTGPESITLDTGNHTGYYYLRVTARNGDGSLDPYTLRVKSVGGPCTANLNDYSDDSTLSGSPGVSTVVLTDPSRLVGSAADRSALDAANTAFASSVPGGAAVVNVADSDKVSQLTAQADAHPECPYAEDMEAQAIRDIVNSYQGSSNTLKYVVIEGTDSVIPYFRYADDSGIADESGFAPPVTTGTASESSLADDMVLSQDAYGSPFDLDVRGSDLPVPGAAVGRLVETPAQITSTLANYTNGNRTTINVSSTLATGYDFLAAAAKNIAGTFAAADPDGTNDTLITDQGVSRSDTTVGGNPSPATSWTSTDLNNAFLQKRHSIVYLAGHFSASAALAADYSTYTTTSDLAAAPSNNFDDTLVISPGCHSGYNIVDKDGINGVTDTLDWAQAFAAQGATLIAGTGYQYGDTDFIKYSNQLYVDLADDLREGDAPVAIGTALTQAKIDYLSGLASVSGVDEKSLLESTLYGLPMQTLTLPASGRTPSPTQPGPVATTPAPSDPGQTLGLSTADISIDPSLTTNTRTLEGTDGNDVTATYLSGDDGVQSEPAAPTLPLVTRNVTAPTGTVLRGEGFWSGSYTDTDGVTPLTGAPATETNTTHGPFVSSVFYPDVLATPNYFGALTGTGGTELMVTPAQYRSDSAGSTTDTQRVYSDLGYHLFYSGNTATYGANTPALAAAPTMSGTSATVSPDGTQVTFATHAIGDPSAGMQDVWVTYTDPEAPGTTKHWQSMDLTQDSQDSTLWTGTLALEPGTDATDLRYLVQAVNGAGKVGADDNAGQYYAPAGAVPPSTPDVTTLMLSGGNPTSATAGASVAVSATLRTTGPESVADLPVTLTLGGSSVIASTDGNGVATATLPVNASPGTATVSASFSGTPDLAPAADGPTAVTIGKRSAALALTAQADSATVTLSDVTSDLGSPGIASRAVFLAASSAAGKILDVVALNTDASGAATVARSSLPPHTATLSAYFGSPNTPSPSGGSFDQTDPLYASAISASLPFAGPPSPVTLERSRPSATVDRASTKVYLRGAHFTPNTVVSLEDPTGITFATSKITPNRIVIRVSVASHTPIGTRHWYVSDPSLDAPITCNSCTLAVDPRPTITAVLPASIARGVSTQLTVTGTGFAQGMTIAVSGEGVSRSSIAVDSPTQAQVTVTVATTQPAGRRSIVVRNADGGGATRTNALTVH